VLIKRILARLPDREQDWSMNRSGLWRSHLTGTMLGQLQLAAYAAVLLGFTGATSTGLWLNERSKKLLLGFIQLQHRHEGFLRNIHLAHRLHSLLAFGLFLQQLLLARNITSVALGQHVFAHRTDAC